MRRLAAWVVSNDFWAILEMSTLIIYIQINLFSNNYLKSFLGMDTPSIALDPPLVSRIGTGYSSCGSQQLAIENNNLIFKF